ncbi:histone lysine methyltransferase Set9, partial [Coemansia sp. RSA 1722]
MGLPSSDSTMDAQTLSKYDDLLSDVLLDQQHLWFTTRKIQPHYRRTRTTNTSAIQNLIHLISHGQQTVEYAVDQLMQLDYFISFLRHKNTERLKDFALHASRYFSMYQPMAGYEIGQTDRYRVITGQSEAKVVATKKYTLGMVISLCSGSVARLSEEEVGKLEAEKVDFSVMWWSKKKSMCLFLGPARFVNHDCDSNCRFTALGSDAIGFQALRTIEPGEEITTNYGNSYFGVDNCECLCATCEKYERGWYYRQQKMVDTPESTITDTTLGSSDELLCDSVEKRRRTRNNGLRSVVPVSCLPKRLIPLDPTPRCPVCHEEQALDTTECARCTRHQKLFGLLWPHRPPAYRPPKQEIKSTKPSGRPTKKRRKQPSIFDGSMGDPTKNAKELFVERMVGSPVLVDPLDSQINRWWPAVIVGKISESGKYQVRYFEDGSFSDCLPEDLKLFTMEWAADQPTPLEDPAIRRAVAYYEYRFPQKRPETENRDDRRLIPVEDFFRSPETTLVQAYVHALDDLISIIDNRDMKPYKARVLDIEVLNN